MGATTDAAICEELRTNTVMTMRFGKRFVIFFDKMAPDFNDRFNKDDCYPLSKITKFNDWKVKENYMSIVKEEENFDTFNCKGHFDMKDGFSLLFLAAY